MTELKIIGKEFGYRNGKFSLIWAKVIEYPSYQEKFLTQHKLIELLQKNDNVKIVIE